MCGIAGLVDIKARRDIDRGALDRMTRALAHRGPDGEGFYIEPGLGFGHRRLAIIDETGGQQPFTATGGTVLCYNGEIYNFQRLQSEIAASGRTLKTRSDTEVLGELLDLRGSDALPRLQGMFAFAAWDPRDETLILARDRLGEKPLYTYFTDDGFLLFASELDALLASQIIPRKIDRTAVADYLYYGYVPDPKTIYRHIHKLPPAHELVIRRGRELCAPRRWWSLKMAPQQGCHYEAAKETLLPTLDMVVSDQMVSDRPVAAFLSGGVDSSAIAASMQIFHDDRITTCAMGFDDTTKDERHYAQRVASHLNTDHHEFTVTLKADRMLPAIAAIYGEPFADTSSIPTALLCRGTRQHTVVALSGDGGDEVFAGYSRYGGILQEHRIRRLLPEFARRGVIAPAGQLYPSLTPPAPAPLRLKSLLMAIGEGEETGYAHAACILSPDRYRALLTEDLRDYRPEAIVETAMLSANTDDPVLAAQAADMATWLPGRMLVKIDRASMAAGLEVRAPLLDHRLVEWSATLPRSFKLKGPTTKRIFKDAHKSRLPEEILYRHKQGFDAPVDGWFRREGGALLDILLRRQTWQDSGYFNRDTILSFTERHREGKGNFGQELWSVLMFDAFLSRNSADRSLLDDPDITETASLSSSAVA